MYLKYGLELNNLGYLIKNKLKKFPIQNRVVNLITLKIAKGKLLLQGLMITPRKLIVKGGFITLPSGNY